MCDLCKYHFIDVTCNVMSLAPLLNTKTQNDMAFTIFNTMKKLFTYSTILIILSLLTISCSKKTNSAITKRHYKNGYYVNKFNKRHHVASKTVETKKTSEIEKTEPITTDLLVSNTIKTNKIESVVSKTEKRTSKQISYKPKSINYKNEPKSYISLNPGVHIINPIINKELKTTVKSSKSDNEEGRSLLWLIVVIILILWLLGFLVGGFATGGLIHLLLVVALILFILWLLRII